MDLLYVSVLFVVGVLSFFALIAVLRMWHWVWKIHHEIRAVRELLQKRG